MDARHPAVLQTELTQVDDPDVCETGCDCGPDRALHLTEIALAQVEALDVLVGAKHVDAH